MTDIELEVTWSDLLSRWDAQQGVYVRAREEGFDAMLSVVDVLVPGDLVAVDLAGGPGSLGQRLLARRPGARCVAVDVDPVLQRVGRGALGDLDGRLRWVRADLRDPTWVQGLGEERVDAVLSSTALHWLEPAGLAELYCSLADLLRPGGVFANFDGFSGPLPAARARESRLQQAVEAIDRDRQECAVEQGAEAWQDWWDAAREVPALADAFAERDRVLAPARGRIFAETGRKKGTSLALHESALLEAGFSDLDVVWQDLRKKVLVAIR